MPKREFVVPFALITKARKKYCSPRPISVRWMYQASPPEADPFPFTCRSFKENTQDSRWRSLPSFTPNLANGTRRCFNRSASADVSRDGKKIFSRATFFALRSNCPTRTVLPLTCKAIYRVEKLRYRRKILSIYRFRTVSGQRIVSGKLAAEGLPMPEDLFQDRQRRRSNTQAGNHKRTSRQEEML